MLERDKFKTLQCYLWLIFTISMSDWCFVCVCVAFEKKRTFVYHLYTR